MIRTLMVASAMTGAFIASAQVDRTNTQRIVIHGDKQDDIVEGHPAMFECKHSQNICCIIFVTRRSATGEPDTAEIYDANEVKGTYSITSYSATDNPDGTTTVKLVDPVLIKP